MSTLKAITRILMSEAEADITYMEERGCDHGAERLEGAGHEDGSDVTTGQRLPTATRIWRRQGENSPQQSEPMEGAQCCCDTGCLASRTMGIHFRNLEQFLFEKGLQRSPTWPS